MYEYKIFEAGNHSLPAMNALLEVISQNGWEPVTINSDTMQILAKRPKLLNDQEKTYEEVSNGEKSLVGYFGRVNSPKCRTSKAYL